MHEKLVLIDSTLQANNEAVARNIVGVDVILTQLERFFRCNFAVSSLEKKGKDLAEPLDAALRIAITMMEMVDKGSSGLDDKLAVELRQTYEKFLGPYREYTEKLER
ncbi:MAG: hypothetical protein A2087_02015 [Spirochaetes bacterium GWD1_61_31]|nr:MAG: hypothetical protein A2004_11985 [Spirochaetes bacterium GWC1_61_12]OHD43797.1 MAG: hypothetical protein A2087_02015 [Spirochaetes bacterium GWD1_61_31]OHD46039.1 MAG: hypothetical protein A2Y35_13570 [Spirochaetes bacterium GWE1_60_18]OHD60611.1 MAG: hypothetical protein A2Y32_08060 [Spirochaetes bacterium GWF1_60_12]HAP43450.1 hypothetical protein [Spirochaetaceae bacterium]